MSFRYLDMEHYERIEHFRYFLSMPYPYAGVTVDIDVTDIVSFCKARGYSFYLTFLHAAAKAADRVPELRRRIKGERVAEYDRCLSSHTVALENGAYCYCTLDCAMPLDEFLPYAQAQVAQAVAAPEMDDGEDPDELYFVSSLPWLSFTGMAHVQATEPPFLPPIITFGKYFAQGPDTLLPIAVSVHHAAADGYHTSKLINDMQALAASSDQWMRP